MVPDVPVTMPRLAWAKAWEWENLGSTHPIIGPVGLWAVDPVSLDDEVRAVLAEPGFVRHGRVTAEFRDVLLSVAEADRECYVWSSPADKAVLTAATDAMAVKITVEGDWLTVERIARRALIAAAVRELPDCPGADFDAFTVPRSQYHPNGSAADTFTLDTTSDYTAPDHAEQLAALMTTARSGVHQLYMSAGNSRGRCPSVPLTAVDTLDYGRVLTYLRPHDNDDVDIACVPGDRATITDVLANTLDALRE